MLEGEIKEVREELEESQKDLTIIMDYLKKKSMNTRKPLLGSKNSDKIDRSKGGSKDNLSITINSKEKVAISSKDKVTGKKSNSPRAGVFKKS